MTPKQIQKTLIEWYHNVPSHPGETRTNLIIGQHFHWKGLQNSAHDICFKFQKRNKRKYGKLPAKQTSRNPTMEYAMY